MESDKQQNRNRLIDTNQWLPEGRSLVEQAKEIKGINMNKPPDIR